MKPPHSFDSGPRVSSSLLEADPSIGVCCKILWIGAKRPTRESALGFKSNHAQSFLVKGERHRCSKACAGVLDFLGPGSRKLTSLKLFKDTVSFNTTMSILEVGCVTGQVEGSVRARLSCFCLLPVHKAIQLVHSLEKV